MTAVTTETSQRDYRDSPYILELKDVTKTFPGVKALDQVKF